MLEGELAANLNLQSDLRQPNSAQGPLLLHPPWTLSLYTGSDICSGMGTIRKLRVLVRLVVFFQTKTLWTFARGCLP